MAQQSTMATLGTALLAQYNSEQIGWIKAALGQRDLSASIAEIRSQTIIAQSIPPTLNKLARSSFSGDHEKFIQSFAVLTQIQSIAVKTPRGNDAWVEFYQKVFGVDETTASEYARKTETTDINALAGEAWYQTIFRKAVAAANAVGTALNDWEVDSDQTGDDGTYELVLAGENSHQLLLRLALDPIRTTAGTVNIPTPVDNGKVGSGGPVLSMIPKLVRAFNTAPLANNGNPILEGRRVKFKDDAKRTLKSIATSNNPESLKASDFLNAWMSKDPDAMNYAASVISNPSEVKAMGDLIAIGRLMEHVEQGYGSPVAEAMMRGDIPAVLRSIVQSASQMGIGDITEDELAMGMISQDDVQFYGAPIARWLAEKRLKAANASTARTIKRRGNRALVKSMNTARKNTNAVKRAYNPAVDPSRFDQSFAIKQRGDEMNRDYQMEGADNWRKRLPQESNPRQYEQDNEQPADYYDDSYESGEEDDPYYDE